MGWIVGHARRHDESQSGKIGLHMDPIALAERLGRWSTGRGPLYVLLARRLRRLVDDGDLAPGTPLPPDRALARALAVGRSTVVNAYELLRAEGRIVRRQGSGTRVAGTPAAARAADGTSAPIFLHLLEPGEGVIPLACAAPTAPPAGLVAAYEAIVPALSAIRGDIGYHPAGIPALRRALADRYAARGLPTTPEQIMITGGGQQALSLLAAVLLGPGGRVVVEAPTYPGALETFHEAGAVPVPLPVGLDGFETAVRQHRPALAYVIPANHNPTGATLPPLRRRRLAEIAATAGVPVIEDEVLADLTFPGRTPPPPLAGFAPATVISVGSLSKAVWGGLRVGWVRAPEAVVQRLARLRAVHDLGGNVPAQLAAIELMPVLDDLCRQRAAALRAGHDHLRRQLLGLLPDWEVPAVTGGQTLWARLPHGDGMSFAQLALRHGVAVLPGAGLDASGGSADRLRLHHVLPQDELTCAVERLAEAWHAYEPSTGSARTPTAMAV
ncbi:PLP-dependent aminotransferase family protein [Pseudonocardia adelaidensis]|uniref:PLP-dependent aminotransferase family protein n=2 Tax=Pseudonocardia adelaidensis TaxID=648754 RepID=A0ABP9NPY3_9PSEU